MPTLRDRELAFARRHAYGSDDPIWWCNLGAAYATCQLPDLKRSRWWYRRAAAAGHVRAWFEYGLMLILGEGGPKQPARGRRFLERAAAAREIDALRVLSHAYQTGGYTFKSSPTKAATLRRTLRRELAQLRKRPAG